MDLDLQAGLWRESGREIMIIRGAFPLYPSSQRFSDTHSFGVTGTGAAPESSFP
jgi:hypothetical protein